VYSKKAQTKKAKKTRKVCSKCGKERLIKFYSTPGARVCNTCKAKAKRLRKFKNNERSRLIKKLDVLWANKIKEVGRCAKCGKTTYLNAHHIYSRSNFSTRWELENGICLCSGCHTLSSKFSAHKTPLEFTEWVIDRRGVQWYDELKKKANKPYKYSIQDLKKLIKKYDGQTNKIQ